MLLSFTIKSNFPSPLKSLYAILSPLPPEADTDKVTCEKSLDETEDGLETLFK